MSEQIALAAVLYFGQVFIFCRWINKNVLEPFLLIIYRTHIAFLINKRRSADALYWTLTLSKWKSSHLRFSIKTLFLKIFQYSQGNTCVKFLRTTILENICGQLLLNWLYEVTVWNLVSRFHLKPSSAYKLSI